MYIDYTNYVAESRNKEFANFIIISNVNKGHFNIIVVYHTGT